MLRVYIDVRTWRVTITYLIPEDHKLIDWTIRVSADTALAATHLVKRTYYLDHIASTNPMLVEARLDGDDNVRQLPR